MFETEINHILSSICMEIENFLIFVYGTFFVGITIIALHYQLRKQSKVSSANLIMKFLSILKEERFKKLWREIKDPNIKKYDSSILSPYLNTFEEIAVFTHEDTLELDHVMEFYGANLKSILHDSFIQEYIDCKYKESDGFSFTKLKWLLKQVQQYGV